MLWAAALLPCCSVKEERADCPCRLEIDLSAFSGAGDALALRVWSGRIPEVIGARVGDRWQSDVRKDEYALSAIRPGKGARVLSDRVVFPDGSEPDSLYAYADGSLNCRAERVLVLTEARKQFCSATLREKEPTALLYRVRSRSGALSRDNLSPLPADLSYPVRREGSGLLRFRIPRQSRADDLWLEVREEGGAAWELPLGEWMEKTGYDWSLPSLGDFSCEIDYAASEVRIQVLDWEGGDALTLKI